MHTFPTMITPYTKSGEVDLATAERYVDWYFENGQSGIFAICQSSEIFWLSLEERVRLNRTVYKRAKELEKSSGRSFTVVSSGHVGDTLAQQAIELNAVLESGTDALILITNRLARADESDDVWIDKCKQLLRELPSHARLGLYECPYPYKRLVTPKLLDFCLSTDRFDYMKDTCCDAATIKERVKQSKGSRLQLLNANCQTLLESLRDGAHGYCGIMSNFHPRLYAWLVENFKKEPLLAEQVQALIGTFGFTEVGLPYPLTAKYHMNLCGIPTETIARNRKNEELTDYGRSCMKQMKLATDLIESKLLQKGGTI